MGIHDSRDGKPGRGHALSIVGKLGGIGRHDFGLCRQRRVVLLTAPRLELSQLAGIVLASVLGLRALEGISHSPPLLFGKDARCIVDFVGCLKRHFQDFPMAVYEPLYGVWEGNALLQFQVICPWLRHAISRSAPCR